MKVQGAAPEMLEPELADSLTVDEEMVVAEVDSSLCNILTVGITSLPIFARMVEAMCWEFSAAVSCSHHVPNRSPQHDLRGHTIA